MPTDTNPNNSPIKLRTYFFVLGKWLGIFMTLGVVLATMTGGQPEAGLFIFALFWFVGTMGGVLHSWFLVSRSSNIAHKVIIGLTGFTLIGWMLANIYFDEHCSYTKREATQKVHNHLKKHKRELRYLSKPTTSNNQCHFTFLYKGGGLKREYVFSRGKLMWMDY